MFNMYSLIYVQALIVGSVPSTSITLASNQTTLIAFGIAVETPSIGIAAHREIDFFTSVCFLYIYRLHIHILLMCYLFNRYHLCID